MEIGERIFVAAVAAIFGFLISQSINIVTFLRRPRLQASGGGALETYTGDPPETPATVTFGFFIKNNGKLTARNVRVFASEMKTYSKYSGKLEDNYFHFIELERPVDLIPGGEDVLMVAGHFSSQNPFLKLRLTEDSPLELTSTVEADTKNKCLVKMKFNIIRDPPGESAQFWYEFEIPDHIKGLVIREP